MAGSKRDGAVPGGAAPLASGDRADVAGRVDAGGRADLHVHTTASDGTLSPPELVAAALAAGLRAVGICDHDSTEGVAPGAEAAWGTGLDVVPGVEINTSSSGLEVHVLGYCYRPGAPKLISLLARIREERQGRVRRMVERLHAAGYPVPLERVQDLAGEGAIGRPHVARALVEAGIAASEGDAFSRFLTPGRPGYVERYKLAPTEAVRAVLAAGGVPVLAHPGLIGRDEIISELVDAGLAGIEVCHTDHSPEQAERYLTIARRYGLLVTGGSDFHGPGRGHQSALGDVSVPYSTVARLWERAR